jgi:hypothetical protein
MIAEPVMNTPVSFNIFYRGDYYSVLSSFIRPVQFNQVSACISRVLEHQKLKENWDGYGGLAPLKEVVENSIRFLYNFPEVYLNDLDLEDIMPTPHGTMNFDWYNGDNYLCVEIGSQSIGYFHEINGVRWATDEGSRIPTSNLAQERLNGIVSRLRDIYFSVGPHA